MTRHEFLTARLAETLAWYRHCEEKAKFVIAINTTLVSVFAGLVFVAGDKRMQVLAPAPRGWVVLLLSSLAVCVLCALISVLRVLWARHSTVDTALPDVRRLWFFGDVAGMSRDDYTRALTTVEGAAFDADVEAMLVSQNHLLATTVLRKHRALNWANGFTMVALACLFLLGVFVALSDVRPV